VGALAWAALAAALACARPAPPPALSPGPPPAPELRVRLAFGSDVDLDLHVTGPLQETVYFANATSASGGRLARDVGCRDPGPRVEEVRFAEPPPGPYRIGVDFFLRCRRVTEPAPFVLEVWADGVRHVRRGTIEFGTFVPRALELHVGDAGP